MNAIALSISNTPIRQDDQGRFCLNDLHKASGGEQKHQPRYWLANQQTQELIAELTDSGIPLSEQNQPFKVVQGGNNQGTFAVKELVYAYAMWISAKFHIAVIRAYDALVSGPQIALKALPEPPTISKAQAGELCAMVSNKSKSSGKPIAYFWSRFNNHWKLGGYRDLPADRFDEARDYLRRLEGDDADQFRLLTPTELDEIVQQAIDRHEQDLKERAQAREPFAAAYPFTGRMLLDIQAGLVVGAKDIPPAAYVVTPEDDANLEGFIHELPTARVVKLGKLCLDKLERFTARKN